MSGRLYQGEVTTCENVIHHHFPRRVLKLVIPGLVLFLLLGLAAKSGSMVVERVEVQQTFFCEDDTGHTCT
jgi:hypothetical protein